MTGLGTIVGMVYDALDRRVEQGVLRGATTEILYGPNGMKLALMNGTTAAKVFAPLSGGGTAVYNASGLAYDRQADWLGSSRLAGIPSAIMAWYLLTRTPKSLKQILVGVAMIGYMAAYDWFFVR